MSYVGDHQHIEKVSRPSLSPQAVAQTILQGFDRHYSLFRYSAQRAKALFESGNWHGIQQLTRERIEYYDTRVHECTRILNRALKGSDASRSPDHAQQNLTPAQLEFWQEVKTQFVALLSKHRQPECAETFFNSVSCRIVHRDYYNNDFLFVRPAVATEYMDDPLPAYRVYYPLAEGLEPALLKMVSDFGLAAPY